MAYQLIWTANCCIRGSQMKTEHPLQKWQWTLFYSKVIARSVNTFIPLGDETINSSLVERDMLLMDSPHPLLHFLIRMKRTSMNVFLQVVKNVEVTREKIWAVRWMLKCFPAKSLKLIPQYGSMGTGITMQKNDSVQQFSRAFWLYGALQHPQPPRNAPHLCALLCLPPFLMLDEHKLHYAHLQSTKETTVWTCAFSLCMSPILQMAVSICNNSAACFCEECVLWRAFGFHFTAAHMQYNQENLERCTINTNCRGHRTALTSLLPLLGPQMSVISRRGSRNIWQGGPDRVPNGNISDFRSY